MRETIPSPTNDDRRLQAERDIADVHRQLTEGELDPATAEQLIAAYRKEIADFVNIEQPQRKPTKTATRARRVVGVLILLGVFAGVSVTAFHAIRPRDGGFITGVIEGGVDLSEVTNDQMEAVIAANPDVPRIAAMRLRLADRYFEEGAFSSALPHYLESLEGNLDRARRARGMARVGWMSYLSGGEETAEAYLVEALEIDPGYSETHLFLGLLKLYRGDSEGALIHLEPLSRMPNLPESTRQVIEDAVARARSSLSSDS